MIMLLLMARGRLKQWKAAFHSESLFCLFRKGTQSITHCRQKFCLMFGNQGVGDFFQVTVHHKIQLVQGEVDAVVGNAALG